MLHDQKLPDEKHILFTQWAKEQGVYIDPRVRPMQLNNRGIGINATEDIKKGDKIVQVPPSAMLTSSISEWTGHPRLPSTASTHAQLAAHLTFDNLNRTRDYSQWSDVWPTVQDFEQVMPLKWSTDVQRLLPDSTKSLLAAQLEKFHEDWNAVKGVLAPNLRSAFEYNWLIVNTRSMYWQHQQAMTNHKRLQAKPTGTYVLSPFLDYFNHSDDGCVVTQTKDGYVVTCQKDIKKGDELYVTYGAHDNDTLLVEYGFVPESNSSDYVRLDHLILPKLFEEARATLEASHYAADFPLPIEPPLNSHRLRVALAALALHPRQVEQLIRTGDLHASFHPRLQEKLKQLLLELVVESEEALEKIGNAKEKQGLSEYQAIMVSRRWEQIKETGRNWLGKLEMEDIW